jgi:hypothetical protein
MKAETLRHWITGAAYNYADGEIWPEWKNHNLMMWVWRLALALGIRSRTSCRIRGDVFPKLAATMIGEARAQNIVDMVNAVSLGRVVGALVDCGVWRGGSTILMTQAMLDSEWYRDVYCCDTFDGFVPSQASEEQVACPAALRVPRGEVEGNFRKYGVDLSNVKFIKGDVCYSLASVTGPIALLRVDVDMYIPTMACLKSLYGQISSGGIVIIDDYGCTSFECKKAVDDFRSKHPCGPLNKIDGSGVWWVKP